MADHPLALQTLVQFGTVVHFDDSMSAAQRELASLTASVTNECHDWTPTHVLLGRAAGLTEDELAHLGDDELPEGLYEPDEAAVVWGEPSCRSTAQRCRPWSRVLRARPAGRRGAGSRERST